MPRPSLFTPARAALIVRTIRETGCSLGAAARVAGIGESTLKDWRKRGLAELRQCEEQLDVDPTREPQSFGEFTTALERALAAMESKLTKCLVDAADRDWRAAAWWLERRRPEVYRDPKPLEEEETEPDGESDKLRIVELTPDQVDELLKARRIARSRQLQ